MAQRWWCKHFLDLSHGWWKRFSYWRVMPNLMPFGKWKFWNNSPSPILLWYYLLSTQFLYNIAWKFIKPSLFIRYDLYTAARYNHNIIIMIHSRDILVNLGLVLCLFLPKKMNTVTVIFFSWLFFGSLIVVKCVTSSILLVFSLYYYFSFLERVRYLQNLSYQVISIVVFWLTSVFDSLTVINSSRLTK